MSEYKFIIFLFIAIVFLCFHFVSIRSNRNTVEQINGVGTISRILSDDSGYTWYYINININGAEHTAQTDTYRVVPDEIKVGDEVCVRWRYTKNGKVRCYITEDRFERVIQENEKSRPISLYISLFFFAIFIVLLVKSLFSI